MEAVAKTDTPSASQGQPEAPPQHGGVESQSPQGVLSRIGLLLAVAALAVSSLLCGQWRFIAPDEGFYLYAGRMALEGLVPYRDFFFPQAPLSPYLFAAWFAVAGRSWVLARVLGSLVTLLACLVLARTARSVYGGRAALWALLTFSLCAGVQLWLPTAKNVGFSALFLALSLDAFLRRRCAKRAAFWLGFGVLARTTVAPAGLFLLLPLNPGRGAYLRQLKDVLLGAALPGMLAIAFVCADPFNFWEGNFGYHLERTTFSDRYLARRRWEILRGLFGSGPDAGLGGFQFAVLSGGALLSVLLNARSGWRPLALPATALVLTAVNFLPEPPHLQYFSVVTFLLVPPAAAALDRVVSASKSQRAPRTTGLISAAVAFSCLAAFGYLGAGDARRFLVTGDNVIGVGKYSRDSWRIEKMSEVSRAIDAANPEEKPVVSGWAGYLVESKSRALRGTENHFAFSWAQVRRFSPQEQEKRHILSQAGAVEAFLKGDASLAVAYAGPRRSRPLLDAVKAAGAKRVAKVGWVEIVGPGGK